MFFYENLRIDCETFDVRIPRIRPFGIDKYMEIELIDLNIKRETLNLKEDEVKSFTTKAIFATSFLLRNGCLKL